MAFIDANRDEFGVEPICTVLRSAGLQVARARITRTRPELRRRGPSATR
ncbi:hypothetical protein I549_4532 [Mycobacterium avium subsp. avium 2285 (R)]|nr:hypothetical protein I549_3675 [Mycobacterium avium subsp. avium 2285 (R)]EUA38433.1 hypothetical protein I549_4532 [Mycobacterium avium subsp. avium 2285 (R)]